MYHNTSLLTAVIILLVIVCCLSLCCLIDKAELFQDYGAYEVRQIPEFLDAQSCDTLVDATRFNLERSTVISPTGSVSNESRTSHQTWLCNGVVEERVQGIVSDIYRKSADITGVSDLSKYECVQIAAYKPTQRFSSHHDSHICIGPQDGEIIRRRWTILVYLNDDFIGGETEFPNLQRKIKPSKGSAILFSNIGDDGCEHPMSLHAGLPVTTGTKFIANIWIRD